MSPLLTYVVLPAACLLIGYVSGYEAASIASHVQPLEEPEVTTAPVTRRRRRGLDGGVILYVIAALALLVAGFTAYQGQADKRANDGRQQAQIRCLNDYANSVADALQARTVANEQREKALDRVLTAAFRASQQKAKPADIVSALKLYQENKLHLAAEREAHPYPEPPRAVCR